MDRYEKYSKISRENNIQTISKKLVQIRAVKYDTLPFEGLY